MVFNAVLSNREHPEYGQVTIPFPFPEEHYDYTMSLLQPLEIGDPLHPDCQVDEIGNTHYTVLKAMEGEMASLKKRFIQNGMPSQELEQFLIPKEVDHHGGN